MDNLTGSLEIKPLFEQTSALEIPNIDTKYFVDIMAKYKAVLIRKPGTTIQVGEIT
jgi:hypothetical protein